MSVGHVVSNRYEIPRQSFIGLAGGHNLQSQLRWTIHTESSDASQHGRHWPTCNCACKLFCCVQSVGRINRGTTSSLVCLFGESSLCRLPRAKHRSHRPCDICGDWVEPAERRLGNCKCSADLGCRCCTGADCLHVYTPGSDDADTYSIGHGERFYFARIFCAAIFRCFVLQNLLAANAHRWQLHWSGNLWCGLRDTIRFASARVACVLQIDSGQSIRRERSSADRLHHDYLDESCTYADN